MEQTSSDQNPVAGYCDDENHAYFFQKAMEISQLHSD